MRKLFWLIIIIAVSAFSGCATLQKPSQELFTSFPIITFGESVPPDGKFILYFPAGKPIPTKVSIIGNIFEQTAEEILYVTLHDDIYTHKDWISFDCKTWLIGKDVLDTKLEIKIPGYDYPNPGFIKLQMDVMQKP